MRASKLLLLVLLALPAAGCTRSSDGTVVIPRQMDMRRIWDREPPVQRVRLEQNPQVFPVSPQTRQPPRRIVAAAPRPRHVPARISTMRNEAAAATSPLKCRNVSEPGKRARVVCD